MRIVWTTAAFVTGVALALIWRFAPGYAIPYQTFFALLSVCLLLILVALLLRRNPSATILALVILLGMWRGTVALTPDIPENYIDIQYQETGTIEASSIITFDRNNQGFTALDSLRERIATTLTNTIGGDAGGLASALITGDRSGLSRNVTEQFRRAGLSHILAISGLHLSLIGGMIIVASSFALGKRNRLYLIAPLIAVATYAALAGFAPPVTRAAIMFAALMATKSLGRGFHMLPAISLAAATMIALQPNILTSISFQLSFAAMLGIALILPKLDTVIEISPTRHATSGTRRDIWAWIKRFIYGTMMLSLVTTLATAPLLALYFKAIPVWGSVATLFVAPVLPILIIFSAIAAFIGIIAPDAIANIIGIPAFIAARYIIQIADTFSKIPPGPIQTGTLAAWSVAIAYAILLTLLLLWRSTFSFGSNTLFKRLKDSTAMQSISDAGQYIAPSIIAILLLPISAIIWIAAINQTEAQHLSVTFLQLTRGESTLIETPSGKRILVDGGRDEDEAASLLQAMIPAWDRHIDIMLLTHPDADHVGGMKSILDRFSVGYILDAGTVSDSYAYANWRKAAEQHQNLVAPVAGMTIGIESEISIEILSAGCNDPTGKCPNINNASVVAKITYDDVSFLLTADIESATERRLASNHHLPQQTLRSTVLKVPHHGSSTSSTQLFLDAVSPVAAVITVGTDNPYGHPHPQVQQRLASTIGQHRIFRTDTQGHITFITNGKHLWLQR